MSPTAEPSIFRRVLTASFSLRRTEEMVIVAPLTTGFQICLSSPPEPSDRAPSSSRRHLLLNPMQSRPLHPLEPPDPPDPPDPDPPDLRGSLLPDLVSLPQPLDLSPTPPFEASLPSAKASRKCFSLSASAKLTSADPLSLSSPRLAGKPLPLLHRHASPIAPENGFLQNLEDHSPNPKQVLKKSNLTRSKAVFGKLSLSTSFLDESTVPTGSSLGILSDIANLGFIVFNNYCQIRKESPARCFGLLSRLLIFSHSSCFNLICLFSGRHIRSSNVISTGSNAETSSAVLEYCQFIGVTPNLLLSSKETVFKRSARATSVVHSSLMVQNNFRSLSERSS
ncbi:unnamed protein product [Microthlaspi erraticum]|uniref:Uncharacterized protein n=1 Tax=Microthlaspi erraticum TaxID=1685480 RepID=A0A6D2K3S7_9BRAS|nr:unnamed protein product [Microthlaspi erraticum]